MKSLSSLTKEENCFHTIDGRKLKNISDLLSYFATCDIDSYSYHANFQKNDFANWVEYVLVLPELAKNLKSVTSLNDSKLAILHFFESFDYRSKNISLDKAFSTVDGFILKSIHELFYYLNNCSDESFYYHVNSQRNDFANWIKDVLLFPDLASDVLNAPNHQEVISLLRKFLISNTSQNSNSEYLRYFNERKNIVPSDLNSDASNLNLIKPDLKLEGKIEAVNSYMQSDSSSTANSNTASNINPDGKSTTQSESKYVTTPTSDVKPAVEFVADSKSSTSTGKIEETIDLSKKPDLTRPEDPDKELSTLDTSGFRQFSDEDLEKFVSFSRREVVVESDTKVDYLKAALLELKNTVRELRKLEKDPLVADLLLRAISSKIDYYAISKSVEDYNHIIRIMKDVQHEIEECANQQTYNLADELMHDLKVQSISLKQNVLHAENNK